MKKSIFRWGFVLSMLLGLLITGVMAAETPARNHQDICDAAHAGAIAKISQESGTIIVTPVDASSTAKYADGVLTLEQDGLFYLDSNITVDALQIDSTKNVTLCLNGYSIVVNNKTAAYFFLANTNQHATLCNCKASGGAITVKGASHLFKQEAGSTLSLYDVTITGCSQKRFVTGSSPSVMNLCGMKFDGSTNTFSSNSVRTNLGTVNMYEGTVIDGYKGYGVNVAENTIFNMYGGTIENCTAGDVYCAGTANIYGGTCETVKTTSTGKVNIYGGTFTGTDAAIVEGNLTKEMPVCLETVGTKYVVTPGYRRIGETVDFKSDLNLNLTLACDNEFILDSYVATVDGEAVSAAVAADGVVTLAATGITAKDMGKVIAFEVKGTDGTLYYGEDLSVAGIADEQYNVAVDEDEAYATLLEDVINYGSAAVDAFGVGEPVDALGFGSDAPTWTHSEGYGASDADIAVATLSLKDKVVLNIYINGEATDVTVDGAQVTATVNNGISCVTIDKAMSAAKKAITLTFTVGENEYTVVYSIKDYVIDALESGEQTALISALQKYIESVCNYVG